MVAMFGTVHAPASVSVGKDRVVFSPWIFFCPLLVMILVIVIIVHEVQAYRRRRFFRDTRPHRLIKSRQEPVCALR